MPETQRDRQEWARAAVEESTRLAAELVAAFYARQAATPPQRAGEDAIDAPAPN
jgi:hypothetical protein